MSTATAALDLHKYSDYYDSLTWVALKRGDATDPRKSTDDTVEGSSDQGEHFWVYELPPLKPTPVNMGMGDVCWANIPFASK